MQNYQAHPLAGATDLDSAMSKLWAFYKKYFVGLYIISAILAIITGFISSTLDTAALTSTTDPEELVKIFKDMAGPYSIILVFSIVFLVILHAWILDKPVAEGNVVPIVLKNSLSALFPSLLVFIMLGILGSMLIAVGLVMLILPGFFAMFYVYTIGLFMIPVTLTESHNASTILSRSFRLAHTNLWPKIAWVVILGLTVVMASIVIGALTTLPFTGTIFRSISAPEETAAIYNFAQKPAFIIISSLASALVTPLFPILAFILYFRNNEEPVYVDVVPGDDDNRVRVEDLYPEMPDIDQQESSRRKIK
jgi:hypothetical protein